MNQQPRIRSGILRSFNSGTYIATVQLTESLLLNMDVATSREIASGDMVAGRKVGIAFFDPANPADAVLFAVWT
jgi:hypothetical protein